MRRERRLQREWVTRDKLQRQKGSAENGELAGKQSESGWSYRAKETSRRIVICELEYWEAQKGKDSERDWSMAVRGNHDIICLTGKIEMEDYQHSCRVNRKRRKEWKEQIPFLPLSPSLLSFILCKYRAIKSKELGSTDCTSRGHSFYSQHLHGGSQPVPGDLLLASTATRHRHTSRLNTYTRVLKVRAETQNTLPRLQESKYCFFPCFSRENLLILQQM